MFLEFSERFSREARVISSLNHPHTSMETGRTEVYVQSFPAGRAKWQISNNGGDYPRWRRDGGELLYVGPDQTLMSVSVQLSIDPARFSRPGPLFKVAVPATDSYTYDIAADGQRILAFTRRRMRKHEH
jgi:eukaryotic-like serine/threonine-protein kinase